MRRCEARDVMTVSSGVGGVEGVDEGGWHSSSLAPRPFWLGGSCELGSGGMRSWQSCETGVGGDREDRAAP